MLASPNLGIISSRKALITLKAFSVWVGYDSIYPEKAFTNTSRYLIFSVSWGTWVKPICQYSVRQVHLLGPHLGGGEIVLAQIMQFRMTHWMVICSLGTLYVFESIVRGHLSCDRHYCEGYAHSVQEHFRDQHNSLCTAFPVRCDPRDTPISLYSFLNTQPGMWTSQSGVEVILLQDVVLG